MGRARAVLLLTPVVGLAVALLVAAAPVGAARHRTTACNLRGHWVADQPETRRYMRSITRNNTITVTSGSLTATFDRRALTLGSVGMHLVGQKSSKLKIKEEVDLEAIAPYRVDGSRLVFGPGTFKLQYVSVVVVLSSGAEAPVTLPSMSTSTPGSSVAYRCTPRTLQLQVPAGGRFVPLNLRRAA